MGSLKKITVQCDEDGCDWEKESSAEDVKEWHKKACPVCGKGEILNDKDMDYFNILKIITDLQDAIDPLEVNPRVEVSIDTSGLR